MPVDTALYSAVIFVTQPIQQITGVRDVLDNLRYFGSLVIDWNVDKR